MSINFTKLNLEEALKWKADLEYLMKHSRCRAAIKRHSDLLEKINNVIINMRGANGTAKKNLCK